MTRTGRELRTPRETRSYTSLRTTNGPNSLVVMGREFETLVKDGACSILALRHVRDEDKALITAVVSRNLFDLLGRHHSRQKQAHFFGTNVPLEETPDRVWLVIDEASCSGAE